MQTSSMRALPAKRKRRLWLIIAVALILIIAIVGAIYIAPIYYIKIVGIELKASEDFEVNDIEYYLQNDPEWSEEQIGDSREEWAAPDA